MDTSTFHESEDRLELYALGRLPDSQIPSIEEHLLMCDSCRDHLDEIAVFALNTRAALIREPRTPYFPGWFSAEWMASLKPALALAGAFVLLVMVVAIYRTGGTARLVPVASLQLTAERGMKVQTVTPARELNLSLADAPPSSRLDLVNADGATVWSGVITGTDGDGQAKIGQALTPGTYYARVIVAGKLRHEYEFIVAR